MSHSLLSNIAVFTNANGTNENTKMLLECLAGGSESLFTFLTLAEKLPAYARFPSANRKTRLEELIRAAATAAIEDLSAFAKENNLSCNDPEILEGRFPRAFLDWINSSPTTLVVKESLPCDGEFGNASKGDILLTRESSAPVLLAHSPIRTGDAVIVGIAPHFEDTTYDRDCIRIVEAATTFAKFLGGTLCVVNAWDIWGEGFVRTRIPEEEIQNAKDEVKASAEQSVERILSKCDLQGVTPERLFGKGDATRVISGAIDVLRPGLVVLGSTAKEGIKGAVLGNTAETIARKKNASVLILR